MKAFDGSKPHSRVGWPHPSLDGEVGPELRDHDEHNQADILTRGLTSLPPSRSWWDQWLWEFVARYSGATVPDSHGVP
jgi:hypothetical protein